MCFRLMKSEVKNLNITEKKKKNHNKNSARSKSTRQAKSLAKASWKNAKYAMELHLSSYTGTRIHAAKHPHMSVKSVRQTQL